MVGSFSGGSSHVRDIHHSETFIILIRLILGGPKFDTNQCVYVEDRARGWVDLAGVTITKCRSISPVFIEILSMYQIPHLVID